MSAEIYLRVMEANCLLTQVESTLPPEVSNFYWKNDAGEKYKVFIPTPNRYLYYNLEEYVGDIDIGKINEYGWTSVKKCVLLALTDTYPEDQHFINKMEYLISNMSTWEQTNSKHMVDVGCDVKHINKNLNRHYRLAKYLVEDIINVPMKFRWRHAVFRNTITIHPDHDMANSTQEMNIGFELAARRFAMDQNYGVYAYRRKLEF